MAALNKENCEDHPRSNLVQNSSAPGSQEDYITQVSEEIEERVTKRLSKEFSRTENQILGALARLDDFLMNPLLPGHSGTTPEPTQNTSHNNQGTNEDGSQGDLHPEAGPFHGQTTRNVILEEDHDMVTGVNEQTRNDHDMVTGVQRERERVCGHDMVTAATETNRNRHDMVTRVQREKVYGNEILTEATQQIGNCHDMT